METYDKMSTESAPDNSHEFLLPMAPIRFKKPAPKKATPVVESDSKVAVATTITTEDEVKAETETEKRLKRLKDLQGKKIVPIPYKEPSWSGAPPSPYSFEVLKGGLVIDTVPLDKPFIVFGRLSQCDVMLEHPSISRFHCVVQYRAEGSEAAGVGVYVYDLSSTHGSYQNKHRLQPKVYNRVQVGHMLKFGGSSRTFLLLGPTEDTEEESPLSVKELQEIARKKQQEKEEKRLAAEQEKIKMEELRVKEEAERGIDWGMGPDACEEPEAGEVDEGCNGPNPFSGLLKADLFLDDPKKSLRGWYEREGFDLPEYNISERSSGHFNCTVTLPVQSPSGEPLIASVSHHGKKKDTVVQAALEACRLLDKHGMLRQATHTSHERAAVSTHDSDDEDEFLDRTGDVARKRVVRGGAKKRDTEYTYQQLSEQHSEVAAELTEVCQRLLEVQRLKTARDEAASAQQDGTDELDAFMRGINNQMPDKHKTLTWKLRCIELRKEEARLRRLVNVAKPHKQAELLPPPLPAELILPGVQQSKDSKRIALPPARIASPIVPKAGPIAGGVHSAFMEEEEAPKLKLTRLDSSDDNVPKPIPYDTRCSSAPRTAARQRVAAKYLVWDEDNKGGRPPSETGHKSVKTNGGAAAAAPAAAAPAAASATVSGASKTVQPNATSATVLGASGTACSDNDSSSRKVPSDGSDEVVTPVVREVRSLKPYSANDVPAEMTSLKDDQADDRRADSSEEVDVRLLNKDEHSVSSTDVDGDAELGTTTSTIHEKKKKNESSPCGLNDDFLPCKKKQRIVGPKLPAQLELVRAAAKRSTGETESSSRRQKAKTAAADPFVSSLEFNDPLSAATWVPPSDQSGDGRTHLNDKLGY